MTIIEKKRKYLKPTLWMVFPLFYVVLIFFVQSDYGYGKMIEASGVAEHAVGLLVISMHGSSSPLKISIGNRRYKPLQIWSN